MLELIENNIIEILATVITIVIGYVGIAVKNVYTKYVDTKTKKEIVDATVKYVEQISKSVNMSSNSKFNEAKAKAINWLNEKGIKITNDEINILIESTVNSFNKGVK